MECAGAPAGTAWTNPCASRDREVAITLMRMALALIDRTGDRPPGADGLRDAIDALVQVGETRGGV